MSALALSVSDDEDEDDRVERWKPSSESIGACAVMTSATIPPRTTPAAFSKAINRVLRDDSLQVEIGRIIPGLGQSAYGAIVDLCAWGEGFGALFVAAMVRLNRKRPREQLSGELFDLWECE